LCHINVCKDSYFSRSALVNQWLSLVELSRTGAYLLHFSNSWKIRFALRLAVAGIQTSARPASFTQYCCDEGSYTTGKKYVSVTIRFGARYGERTFWRANYAHDTDSTSRVAMVTAVCSWSDAAKSQMDVTSGVGCGRRSKAGDQSSDDQTYGHQHFVAIASSPLLCSAILALVWL